MSNKNQTQETPKIIAYTIVLIVEVIVCAMILLCKIHKPQTFVVDGFQWERKIPVEKSTWVIRNELQDTESAVGETIYYCRELQWTEVRSCDTAGADKNAYWGDPELKNDEREGKKEELYFVIAHTDSKKPVRIQVPREQWEDVSVGDPLTLSRSLFAILTDAADSLEGGQEDPAATETLREETSKSSEASSIYVAGRV